MSLKRLLYGGLPQLGGGSYQSIVLNIAPSSLLAYWPLTETSGTTASDVSGNARHGTYSGVTLAQIAGPGASMGSAGLWDGVNDNCDIFSASLDAAFNKNLHTIAGWAKVSAVGVWTDTSNRFAMTLGSGSSGLSCANKSNSANAFALQAYGGAVGAVQTQTTSTTDWFHFALTVNGTTAIPYFNGTALAAITRGTWVVALTNAWLGTGGGANYWSGYLAHHALWSTALTPAQITTLATAR